MPGAETQLHMLVHAEFSRANREPKHGMCQSRCKQ